MSSDAGEDPQVRAPAAGWWRHNARALVVTAACVGSAVLVLGLTTDLHAVMHTALLVVSVTALLPFIIIGGIVLVVVTAMVVLAVMAALLDSDASAALEAIPADDLASPLEATTHGIAAYYRFLGRRRHPVLWGIPLGLLLGGLSCWATIAVTVVPKEVATARVLSEAHRTIEAQRSAPEPVDGDRLVLDDEIVADGFGRPLRYDARGRWKLRAWSARSAGADGRFETADDLCVSGGSTLVGRAAELVRLLAVPSADSRIAERLEGVLALRC